MYGILQLKEKIERSNGRPKEVEESAHADDDGSTAAA